MLENWPALVAHYGATELEAMSRGNAVKTELFLQSMSGTTISKVAMPKYEDHGELLK